MEMSPFAAVSKQFNSGAPIPPVNASDIKQMWDSTRRMKTDLPLSPNAGISLTVYAAYGVEAASASPEQFMWIMSRHQLVSALAERGVLNDYMHGEELDEKVCCAAATMPCDKHDLAEARTPLWLAQVSAEVASKTRERMHAAGQDPDKPKIDDKFLEWLCDHC